MNTIWLWISETNCQIPRTAILCMVKHKQNPLLWWWTHINIGTYLYSKPKKNHPVETFTDQPLTKKKKKKSRWIIDASHKICTCMSQAVQKFEPHTQRSVTGSYRHLQTSPHFSRERAKDFCWKNINWQNWLLSCIILLVMKSTLITCPKP